MLEKSKVEEGGVTGFVADIFSLFIEQRKKYTENRRMRLYYISMEVGNFDSVLSNNSIDDSF